ncbi:hypothetical protein HN873_057749 [Arachis hypogaea]
MSEPLNLYESLPSYFVLKYSESVAKRVEGLLEMLHKLRNEMLRDDLSLPFRRDRLILYFKCLCMIEPFFQCITQTTYLCLVQCHQPSTALFLAQHPFGEGLCSLQPGSPLHPHCSLLRPKHHPRPSPCHRRLK